MTNCNAPLLLALTTVFTGSLLASCDQEAPEIPADVAVVATVNGTPISELDVQLAASRSGSHGGGDAEIDNAAILQNIILQEIARQKAVDAGYDDNTEFRNDLYALHVQLEAFQRSRLAEVYYAQEFESQVTIGDEEARRFFDDNADIVNHRIRVWQIFRRDKMQIEQDLGELRAGDTFEQVAGKRFPDLPQLDREPWDLGYMHWTQLPDSWWESLRTMGPGDTSEIIEGPNDRYWIIRLIDKERLPGQGFEDAAPRIRELLKNQRMRTFQGDLNRRLLESADIKYPN
jgi:hypothetical protein